MCQVWWKDIATGVVSHGEIMECNIAYWVANMMNKMAVEGDVLVWVVKLNGA